MAEDRLFVLDHLTQFFESMTAEEFYREIFPKGELEAAGKKQQGKYNGVAVELLPKSKNDKNARRYVVTDEFEIFETLLNSDNFIIISPISYIGRSRQSNNARFIYALAIDLDGITKKHYLIDLINQIDNDILPKPTFLVWSGSGLHLYYKFEKPIPCFENITKQLANMKSALITRIWNKYVTELYEKPQIQSLFQGFRMVGTVTKGGNRAQAFRYGEPVSIEYLNSFVPDEAKVKEFTYKSAMTLKEAAEKYPEWYERRIINKQPKNTWKCKEDLYNWWLKRLRENITEGHRYYGIMCLAIYAKKSGIDRKRLEKDAFELLDFMESLTITDNNHFTRSDILAALELYNDNYITFPIDTITEITQITIEKNKRNYRKQETHLKIARSILNVLNEEAAKPLQGRPKGSNTKKEIIEKWQQANPKGTKAECIKETKISKPTVYKYWSKEK